MFTTIHGLQTYYQEQGSGPALLLLHGFPLDHRMWQDQIDYFKTTHRVIAPDLRGLGQSDPHKDLITLDHLADELLLLLDQLQVEKAVLAGFSMGGYVAFSLMRKAPQRFAGLVLANTRPDADPLEGQINRMKMAASLLEKGTHAAADSMIPKLLTEETLASRPSLAEELNQQILDMDALGLVHATLAMAFRKDSTELLAEIEVPTLVIAGEKDTITTPELMRTMASQLPQAEYVQIEGAAHLTTRENPQAFNQHLEQFLNRIAL
ncbi:alpha/beta fold hydrolase [Paenibacillus lutrae]|uniref:Alpha/beta fold hydrolase n=1 Tax=Paenibacillus lutrae TaxID=2078573 RepID=A0A7X3K176_9BACL|nr:alpha/beta hydrolase [Paenibacillus lutrae]MVP01825.1 alpha/beta fold hydrolase [Paenibacillus lutrae]